MKKILSVLLCVCMLLGTCTVFADATELVKDDSFTVGDANCDGACNAKDILSIKSSVAGFDTFVCDKDAADIDMDGATTLKDAYILKLVAAEIKTLSSYEQTAQLGKLTIAGNDIKNFKIELPAGTTTDQNIDYAASELRKYITKATGYSLTIVKGTVDGPKISFTEYDMDSEMGEQLGIEGYIYEVKDGNLYISATIRGAMYAVYEILEDIVGFRFYLDDYTFLYKQRVVDIPEDTYKLLVPEVATRNCRANFDNEEEHNIPLRVNFTEHGNDNLRHGYKNGSEFINAHSYGYYWRMGTGTNPQTGNTSKDFQEQYNSGEQQNELAWQPCASTDSVYQTMFQGMLDTISMIISWGYNFTEEKLSLGIMSMSFSGCDNTEFCLCRICRAKVNGTRAKASEEVRNYLADCYGGEFTVDGNYVTFQKEYYSGVYMDFSNRAAEDIQEYYPGLRVHAILYDHNIPATIRPSHWMNVWYCGSGCNNHWLGSNECKEEGGQLKYPEAAGYDYTYYSNIIDEKALPAWGEFCEEAGAQLWFWYYPVTYAYYLCGCPNIINLYYDYKYLVEECGVDCLFYEGGGENYNFEELKGYLAARLAWDPHMSYDTFVGHIKEFLYMYYGDGYEYIYDYLLLQNEAGDACGHCFINNYDRPGDMYSLEYVAEHYEEMRALLVKALGMTDDETYKERIETMLYCFDFLGLSACYNTWYKNGTTATKAHYVERYDAMMEYFWKIDICIFPDEDIYKLPTEKSYDEDPMTQFYEDGSRRLDSAWG